MLDDPDVDDPVERALDVAIVHQLELHPVRDARSAARSRENSIWSGASATPSTSTP
jgi:hypothetical protein